MQLFADAEMKQLPTDTVRLLTSTQVITCVVNVVKELLENSLDADATSIEIKLENYGLDQIEVKDNGSGIKAADTPVMAVKHYTSKICSHDDLERLETYGFRGEALGSICAVAEVTVTTRTAEDDISTQYMLDSTGRVTTQRPSHLGKGTTVSVQKLFKSLPVRRQYYSNMKKCKEELKNVQDLLMAYAIIKPELRLTLTHNKVVVWQKAKASDHKMALLATLGASTVANLILRQHRQEQPQILIDGFFPKPGTDYCSTSSSNPDKTFVFVNDRPVQQKDILKLVRQHYTAQYPGDSACRRYPILMLSITVPASTLDVNLRPDKTQVLLHNKDAVLTALEALLVSLYGSGSIAEAHQASRTDDSASPMPLSPQHAGSSLSDSWTISDVQHNLGDDSVSNAPPARSDISIPNTSGTETLQPLISNSSSSSASADDWIVNQIPVDFDLSLLDPDTAPTCTGIADPGAVTFHTRLTDNPDQEHKGENTKPLSEESWSRGTALIDPSTGDPLQPVRLHVSTASGHLGKPEVKDQCSPDKKVFNAITVKQASLKAYDLISNRAVRTPLSPTALFERETRGEILKEKPKASLKDISAAVQERWKNLGEEDRKNVLGGAEFTQALCSMEMGSPELNGISHLTDSRILANGFKIQCNPDSPSTERHLEVTAMANCMPFFGMEDLREILTAVVQRNAKAVGECRPLKVSNYFQGEAVRLARQLPMTLSREDVENTLSRMQQQLGDATQTCIHGHPFLHHLCDVPDTEEEAKTLVFSNPV